MRPKVFKIYDSNGVYRAVCVTYEEAIDTVMLLRKMDTREGILLEYRIEESYL